MIDQVTAKFLDGYFRRVAIREGAEVVALTILTSHVHIILRTPARFDLPHMVQAMKGGSSYEVNHLPGNRTGLRWNHRYFVSTVSPRALSNAIAYVSRQSERHPGEEPRPEGRAATA
jgi:REP element-mobilizing transposase RayT